MTKHIEARANKLANFNAIVDAIKGGASPNWEIAEVTGLKLPLCTKLLSELEEFGVVEHPHRGVWQVAIKSKLFPLVNLEKL